MLLSGCRIGHLEPTHGVNNDLRDDQASVVLIVCGHNIPRSVMRAGCADALLVSLHVVFPEFSLMNVRKTQLPVLLRIIDACQKPLTLFILGKVQKDFHDVGAVSFKVLFEVHDGAIAILPF